MTFRWTRTPGRVTATCDACGTQITGRTDTQILRDQRGHDLAACITRQRAARVAAMADTDESHQEREVTVSRYCLAVCYCGKCEHWKPMPGRTTPIVVHEPKPKSNPNAWTDRDTDSSWIDKL